MIDLGERAKTHGDYAAMASVYQRLDAALQPHRLQRPEHALAVSMIAVKLARIVCGDPGHRDHWDDIAGYARLAAADEEDA